MKKAQLTLRVSIGIILGVCGGLLLVLIASQIGSKEVAKKEAIARSVALNINFLCASPKNIEFSEIIDWEKYVIEISSSADKQEVIVYSADLSAVNKDSIASTDPTIGRHEFICNDIQPTKLTKPKKITISKNSKGSIVVA